MNWIPYKELQSDDAGFSRLFVDYIDNFSRVKDFYSVDFRDTGQWKARLDSVLKRDIDRSALVQVLVNQNRDYHCGVKTLANIDLLLNDNTVAVITGQQVGLLSGPLYTLFKTITVLKLTESLSVLFPDYNFVPVFWLEGEDHDIEEVSSINILNSSNELVNLKYEYESKSGNIGAVGNLRLTESINILLDNLRNSLLQTEYSSEVQGLFATAYQKDMTLSRSFIHLVNVLLENSGLIFFDPNNSITKNLTKPLFEKELTNKSETCRLVIGQSEVLEKQYHAQVKPRAVNLFMFHNEGRYAIEPAGEGFSLKGTRQVFGRNELLDLLNTKPEIFSPNVVFRPICQDYLFPTYTYVAGPSEVAYFAQFKTLYESFGIPEPIIYPRASATIIEEKIRKILDKYNLGVVDFFTDVEILKGRISVDMSDFKAEELFNNTAGTITESITSLKDGLSSIDPTLIPALENTLSKIQHAVTVLKEKTLAAQKKQHEIQLNQLNKAAASLFPNSRLQERTINISYFLNKYGPEFLRWLRSELVIDKFMHQVVNL